MPAPDLALLAEAARAGGEIALRRAGDPGAVREKPGGNGPVTEADLEVDWFLRTMLLAARPDYGWLSEETEDGKERLDRRRVFIVDPIDGTRAFLAGQKSWALSLAVVEEGRAIAGIVHLPMLGRTYAAAAAGGATLNGESIATSRRRELDGARLLVNGNQLAPEFWPGGVPAIERHFRPSLAYRLCLAAEGRFDGMLTFRDTWEWDVAAGDLIAREAGARVTTREGRALAYNNPTPLQPGILAAAPALYAAIAARLRPAAEPAQPLG